MPTIPVVTPLGYLGVFFLIVGFFFVIAGLDILKVEKLTVATGRKTWGTGLLVVVIGFLFLLPDIVTTIRATSTVVITPTAFPVGTFLPDNTPTLTTNAIPSPMSTDPTILASLTATNSPQFSTPVQDVRVRQAIAFCTDRRALAQSINPTFSSSQIEDLMIDSFLPKTHWAYSRPTTQYPYDPATGQVLLEQAGWTLPEGGTYRINIQGKALSLILTTGTAEYRQTWVAVFKTQMQACGIQLQPNHIDPSLWFGENTGYVRGDFELGVLYWDLEENPDVNDFYGCDSIPSSQNDWQGNNAMGWCNPTASEAAKKAADLSLSQSERKQFFIILQEEFAKDVPSLPVFLHTDVAGWEHIDFNLSP